MSTSTADVTQADAGRLDPVQRIALGFVWTTFAASAVVFTEPAPVDALMLVLVWLLPIVGLVRLTPQLLVVLAIWMTVGGAALLGTLVAIEPRKALVHSSVTFFLIASSFVVAAFIMRRPLVHSRLILNAWTLAALIAVLAALSGYFRLLPGAYELFTRHGRAAGTFKDPNVFGPFLVAPAVYLLHGVLAKGTGRALLSAAGFGLLVLGVLLSFSRGAWMSLAVSVAVFGYLSFLTAESDRRRAKILAGAAAGIILGLAVLAAALQIDAIAAQFESRATLDQTYDQGPEGRFGGQAKARRIILENPFGIGAQQFAPYHHAEEPHNVYLAMYLNAGWLGGTLFALMVLATGLYGLRHAFRRRDSQPLFVIAYASFLAHAFLGFIIDLDHWRHFHLLMAMIWGLMLGDFRAAGRSVLPLDPRAALAHAKRIASARPARLLLPLHTMPGRRPAVARRSAGSRDDSRPGRAVGRSFAREVPGT